MIDNKVSIVLPNFIIVVMDFGIFNQEVQQLVNRLINERYTENKKYGFVSKVLYEQNTLSLFWEIYGTLLQKGFDFEKEFELSFNENFDITKETSEKTINFAKEHMRKRIPYEYYTNRIFESLLNTVYDNIIKTNYFRNIEILK